MKRRFFLLAGASLLLSEAAAIAQPGRDHRPDRPGPDRPGPDRPGRPGPGRPGRPGPGMRPPPRPPGRPPQFSWRGRYYNRFRAPAFRYPRGYAYRRWSIGAFLPSLFLSTTYFWDDWRTLGVGAPPPGRRWVRYGPDLLLVNVRTRRVEDVIPDAFF